MRTVTATEAARSFSALLDAVEHRGESFTITRNGAVIASVQPRPRLTGRELKAFLATLPTLDDGFADDVQGALGLVVDDVTDRLAQG